MNVICLEDEAYYELLDKVISFVDSKLEEKHQSKWIGDGQARSLLGNISKSTLQRLRNEGKIEYSQPMRKIILYNRDSIYEYLEKHKRKTF